MENNIDNGQIQPPYIPEYKIFRDYASATEDVDALLNALVHADNVPNDIFENLRLQSVTRYYMPLCVFAGDAFVKFSYEKTKGEKVWKVTDTMQAGVILKIPCHVKGACPPEISQEDEVMLEISFGGADKETLQKMSKGWKVEFPEGVDGEAVINQHSDEMDALLHDFAMKELKEELGNVDKLKILELTFRKTAGEILDFITLCRQPFSIIEYEYKGKTYKAIYEKGVFRDCGLPEDTDSKQVQNNFYKRMALCVVGMVAMLIVQFALLHSWPVTLIVLLALIGVAFKFSHDLSKIQETAAGERGEHRKNVTADDYLKALRASQQNS